MRRAYERPLVCKGTGAWAAVYDVRDALLLAFGQWVRSEISALPNRGTLPDASMLAPNAVLKLSSACAISRLVGARSTFLQRGAWRPSSGNIYMP